MTTFDLTNAFIFNLHSEYVSFNFTGTDCSISFFRGGTAYAITARIDGGSWTDYTSSTAFFTNGLALVLTSSTGTHQIDVASNNSQGGLLNSSQFIQSSDPSASLSPVPYLIPGTQFSLPSVTSSLILDGTWDGTEGSSTKNDSVTFCANNFSDFSKFGFSGGACCSVFVNGVLSGFGTDTPAVGDAIFYDLFNYVGGVSPSENTTVRVFQDGTTNNNYYQITDVALSGASASLVLGGPVPFSGVLGSLGDSISFGQVIRSANYTQRLSAALNLSLNNFAVSGASVAFHSGVPQVATQVSSLNSTSKFVTLMAGTNDLLQGSTAPAFQAAYISLLESIRTQCPSAKIVVIQTIPRESFNQSDIDAQNILIASFIETVGDANTILVNPNTTLMAPGGDFSINYADGTHPNASGYGVMFPPILAALSPSNKPGMLVCNLGRRLGLTCSISP